jgi:hypothetical protein
MPVELELGEQVMELQDAALLIRLQLDAARSDPYVIHAPT